MLDSYARRHMLCRMLCLLSLITFSFFLSTPQDSFFLLPCICSSSQSAIGVVFVQSIV